MIDGLKREDLVFDGQTLIFDRKNLPAGIYFFKVSDKNGAARAAGKLVLR